MQMTQPTKFMALGVAATALALAAPGAAVRAQVPFRISRPENNATVRETVRIQVPRAALGGSGVGEAKYLSYTIDGRFRIAVAVPPVPENNKTLRSNLLEWNNRTVNYLWDTKAVDPNPDPKLTEDDRIVKDGRHTIEVVALDGSGKRIGVQTITVNVSNRGGLAVPSGGVPLNYRFQIGDTSVYKQRTEVEYIGDRKAPVAGSGGFRSTSRGARGGGGGAMMGGGIGLPGEGGPPPDEGSGPPPGYAGPGGGYPGQAQPTGPFSVPVQTVNAEYLRSTEDVLGGNVYFVRDKVTGGTIVSGNGAGARLQDVYEFKSRYRSIFTTGGIREYGVASSTRPGAYVALPIIDLGGGRRRVQQTWRTRVPVQLEWATLDRPPLVTASNMLEGLEWQDGYQTARIRQTFKGKTTIPIYGGAGQMRNASVEMDRVIWFGFRAGRIVRMETTVQVSGDAPSDILSAMVPAAGISTGTGFGGGLALGGGGGPEGEGLPAGFPSPGGPAGVPGGGTGFGGQPAQAPRVPAKFRSVTTVTLANASGGGR